MRTTYYYCYQMPRKKDWLKQSIEELSWYLSRPPVEVNYAFSELSEEHEADILKIFQSSPKTICVWEAQILDYFLQKERNFTNLFVACPQNSHLKRVSLQTCPSAQWGIANESLAIVYEHHSRIVVWHELLHLLGADDCYDMTEGDWGPNCGLPNCIMQYQATINNVGDWPFLCEKNIEKIQKRITEWKNEP